MEEHGTTTNRAGQPMIALSKPTRTPEERAMLFRGYRAAGFDALQLKSDQFIDALDTPEAFVDRWGDDPAIADTLILFGALDDAGVERLRRTIRLSALAGGHRVVVVHDHTRPVSSSELRGFAERLSELGLEAHDAGISLTLHHHSEEPVATVDEMERFFSLTIPDSVGLTLDVGHLVRVGADLPDAVRRMAPVIDNVHLKDVRKGEWALLGQGDVDLDALLASLAEIGYSGPLCVDEETATPLAESIAISAAWVRSRGL